MDHGWYFTSTEIDAAHRLGEIVFSAKGRAVPLDISFDEDRSGAP
jgi:hypothetical protein